MTEWVFWVACGLIAYTYGGYLVVLVVADAMTQLWSNARWLSGSRERRAGPRPTLPRISVLVAAYNEETWIRRKIENTLGIEYEAGRLEILVGSDGSTDRTDAIVGEFAERGVVLSAAPRGGKAQVLNRLAAQATGDVFLFTDANTMIEPDALRLLVRRLDDARVGGVCGRLRLVAPDGAPRGEGAYWAYENLLKFYEGKRGAIVGANGGLYVLRREEWQPLPPDTIVDDFLATMRVLLRGRRLAYDPEAVAKEETAPDLAGEFGRRVRISAGNFQSLGELAPMLFRPGFKAFAFWSHKVLRWCVPAFTLAALGANALLAGDRLFYATLFAGQAALYALALLSRYGTGGRLASTARYFAEMNLAIALGFLRFVRGSQKATWQRTARLDDGARTPAP